MTAISSLGSEGARSLRGNRALVVNQLLALAMLWMMANAMHHSTCELVDAQHLDIPAMSETFLRSLGQTGLLATIAVSAIAIIGIQWGRNERLRVVLATLVFLATVTFLLASMLWSYLPLQRAVRLAAAITT